MAQYFNPNLITPPQPLPPVAPVAPPAMEAPMEAAPPPMAAPVVPPIQPPPQPKPVFVPVPVVLKAQPKPKGMTISPEAARKAQGIYPNEQREKQAMIDNAKAPPSPTGAWGAPE